MLYSASFCFSAAGAPVDWDEIPIRLDIQLILTLLASHNTLILMLTLKIHVSKLYPLVYGKLFYSQNTLMYNVHVCVCDVVFLNSKSPSLQ